MNLEAEMLTEAVKEQSLYAVDDSDPQGQEGLDLKQTETNQKPTPIQLNDFAPVKQWVTEKPPEKEWVIHNIIPAGDVGIMAGQGGTGKSNLSLLMARCVATGEWIEPFRPIKPRKVLLINVEDGEDDLWRRIYAQTQIKPLSADQAYEQLEENLMIYPGRGLVEPFMGQSPGGDPEVSEWGLWFKETVEQVKPELIITDTLSRLYGLDENSNAHAARWIGFIESVSRNNKAAVLIIHHVGKAYASQANQIAARGASAFVDNVRFSINLTHMQEQEAAKFKVDNPHLYFSMELSKVNYTAKGNKFFFRKGDQGFPELVDLEKGRMESAADMLEELLSVLAPKALTWRELKDRGDGKEIRKQLKESYRITKPQLSPLWDVLVDSKRAELVKTPAGKGQLRNELRIVGVNYDPPEDTRKEDDKIMQNKTTKKQEDKGRGKSKDEKTVG